MKVVTTLGRVRSQEPASSPACCLAGSVMAVVVLRRLWSRFLSGAERLLSSTTPTALIGAFGMWNTGVLTDVASVGSRVFCGPCCSSRAALACLTTRSIGVPLAGLYGQQAAQDVSLRALLGKDPSFVLRASGPERTYRTPLVRSSERLRLGQSLPLHDIPRTLRVHTRERFAPRKPFITAKLRRLRPACERAPGAPQLPTSQRSTA